MGRSLSAEKAVNAVLNSAFFLKRENRNYAEVYRLFGAYWLSIVAAQITD